MTVTVEETTSGVTADVPGFMVRGWLLRDALVGASLAMSKDATLPAINGVLVEWVDRDSGPVVTVTATDRYQLVTARVPAAWVAGEGSAILSARDVKAIIGSLPKETRATIDVFTEVRLQGGVVTVTSPGHSMSCVAVGALFPKWQSLIPSDSVLTGDGVTELGMYVNPAFLGTVSKIPASVPTCRIRFHSEPLRPVLVDWPTKDTTGVDFRVLIMPVRMP